MPGLNGLLPPLLAVFSHLGGGGSAPELAPPEPAAEHPAALSHLDIHFQADTIEIGLRVQELTLREVPRWMLDTDLSGQISNFELEEAWDRVSDMLVETLWIELDGTVEYMEFDIVGYPERAETLADGSFHFDLVQLHCSLPRPESLTQGIIHSDLFLDEGNPKHRTIISVTGLGVDGLHSLTDSERRELEFTLPGSAEVLSDYLHLGWEHVLEGYDHLAFLIALLFGVACLTDLLWAVTAFTLAHSVTLAISALDILTLPGSLVEPGIALSVLLVLGWHLRRGRQEARPWIPALAFGLLHGFGFAGVLGEIGIPEGTRVSALLGFNLGVEAGQLTFVLPVALLAWFGRRQFGPQRSRVLREAAAVPALAFAMYLVGGSLQDYWLPPLDGWSSRLTTLGLGALCALPLCLLPSRHLEGRVILRRTTLQGALLLVFFTLGQHLRA